VAHLKVRSGLSAGAVVAVCVECRTPRLRHGAAGTLRQPGSADWAQTSDHRGGPETGDQGARALAPPPAGQRASGGSGGVAVRGTRRHRRQRELARDSLRAPSWSTTTHSVLSTTAQNRLWTLQSLAGVDHHCEALAAATNNNLVGVPPGHTRMAEWPAAAGEAEREKTTPPRRLAFVAAPPPRSYARCTGYSPQRDLSAHSEGEIWL